MSSLDYNEVASGFDRRYELHAYPGVQRCLLDFVSDAQRLRVLEVGCGTGRWLALLDVAIRVAERLQFERSFHQAVQDGILDRSFTSQLWVLSADEYAAGMRRISEAAQRDDRLTLKADLELYATEAAKP